MTTATNHFLPASARPLRVRRKLTPDETARRQVRRRLLRYIMASHQRRIADRGRTRLESALGGPA